MLKKFLNIISLSFKGYSLLRTYQLWECRNIKLNGNSLEFGSYKNKKRNFCTYFKGNSKFNFSNTYNNKDKDYIKLDLTKKLKLKNHKFDNVIIFNVLEHIPNPNFALVEINKILNKNGNLIGSTPFIYQVHGAPNDYFRFTKDFFYKNLAKKKFKNIDVKALGYGPFVASYTLIHSYLKFFPIIREILLVSSYLLDTFIQIFVKTKLNEIYPIGFFFKIKK